MSAPGPQRLERFVATLLLVAGLGVVSVQTLARLDLETAPRALELAFPESLLLQAAVSDPQAPDALRAAGATTLVRVPHTLDELLRLKLAEAWRPAPDRLEVRLADRELAGQAAIFLTGQLGMESVRLRLRPDEFIFDLVRPAAEGPIDPRRYILNIPMGPMPNGFRRALLLPAGDWSLTRDLDQFTQALYSLRPDLVIPWWLGGSHPGAFFRSYLNTPWLRRPLLALPDRGVPEAGRWALRRLNPEKLVQTRMLGPAEFGGLALPEHRQRLLRELALGRVGLLLCDPPQEWTWARSLTVLGAIKHDLVRAGFHLGPIASVLPSARWPWSLIILYAAIMGLCFLGFWKFAVWAVGLTGQAPGADRVVIIRLRPLQFRWAAGFVGVALLILHFEGSWVWGGKAAGFLLSVLGPWLILATVRPPDPKASSEWIGLGQVARVAGLTLVTGLGISALLFQPRLIMGLDQALWGRMAFWLPSLLAGSFFLTELFDAHWWRGRWVPTERSRTLTVGALVLAGLALLVLRSTAAWSWTRPAHQAWEAFWGIWAPGWLETFLAYPLLGWGLMGYAQSRPGQVGPKLAMVWGLFGPAAWIAAFGRPEVPLLITLGQGSLSLTLGYGLGLLLVVLERWLLHLRRRQDRA